MKIAMFPGSFDPIHEGHIDIIKRASKLFDKLLVVVSINVDKKQSDLVSRYQNVKKVLDDLHLNNVEVHMNNKFTIDFANEHHCEFIVRSLRNRDDFDYELMVAQANYKLDSKINTVFLISNPSLANISSHAIREMEKNIKLIKNKK